MRYLNTVESHSEESEGILPIVAVLLVLVAVVVLFLLLKFNLFNGGTSPNVHDTLPAVGRAIFLA